MSITGRSGSRRVQLCRVGIEALESRRLFSGGQIDSLYGTNGRTELQTVGTSPEGDGGMIQLPSGKFITSISTFDSIGQYLDVRTELARFDADGTPDSTWGTNGVRYYDLDWTSVGSQIYLEPSGSMLLVGANSHNSPATYELKRINADGSIDPNFNFSTSTESFRRLKIQSDGKILALMSGGLHRLNHDGTPDTTFGTNGVVARPANYIGYSIDTDSLGRVIMAGTDGNSTTWQINRFTTNGQPDPTFDGDGIATIFVNKVRADAYDVRATSDGGMVIAGDIRTDPNDPNEMIAVAKLTSGGAPDLSFNGTGMAVASIAGANASASAVFPQSDGSVVVLGGYNFEADRHTFAARFTSAGQLDSNFDGDGMLLQLWGTRYSGGAVAADTGGSLVVASATTPHDRFDKDTDTTLTRVNLATGTIDTSFGTNGQTVLPVSAPHSSDGLRMFQMADGRTLAFGADSLLGRSPIFRILVDGSLDSSFGNGAGWVDLGANFSSVSAAVRPDGKILVVGATPGSGTGGLVTDWTMIQLNPDGTRDASFGSNGQRTYDYSTADLVYDMRLLADGRFLLLGYRTDLLSVAARFNADGTLDTTFGTNGFKSLAGALYQSLGLLGDGRIVVAGYNSGYVNVSEPFSDAKLGILSADGKTFTSTTVNLGSSRESFDEVLVGPNDSLYLLATEFNSSGTPKSYFARATTALALDSTFGAGGQVALTESITAGDWKVLSDGSIAYVADAGDQLWLYHRTAAGSLDANFATNGKAVVDLRSGPDSVTALGISENSSYLVLGKGDGRGMIARVLSGIEQGSIAGKIYNDVNRNGVRDSGEANLSGRTVYIDANNNQALDPDETSTTTDSNGDFLFGGLLAGSYTLRQVQLAGWSQTFPAASAAQVVNLLGGQDIGGVWFASALTPLGGSIAGTVYNDVNSNAKRDAGEVGVANVTVYNDANNNSKLDSGELTTTTDGNGAYTLSGLPSGPYKIRQILQSGWTQTTPTNNYGWTITLATDQQLTGKDFGTRQTPVSSGGSISGTVYNDANSNAKRDTGEVGVAGITIYNDANNNSKLDSGEATTITDANGAYTLTNLAAGSYKIREILQSGWSQTTPAKNYGWTITLATNRNLAGKDFGTKQTGVTPPPPTGGSIAGVVWNDLDGDGVKDSNEVGVGNITIYNDANNNSKLDAGELTTITDGSGAYALGNLAAGSYKIREILQSGWSQTTPANNYGWTISLASNQQLTGKNFGTKQSGVAPPPTTGSISGFVFNDNNKNGTFDAGDVKTGGKTVFLDMNNNGKLDSGEKSVVSDSSGNWSFTGLSAGTYHVRRVFPSGYTYSTTLIDLTLNAGDNDGGLFIGSKQIA